MKSVANTVKEEEVRDERHQAGTPEDILSNFLYCLDMGNTITYGRDATVITVWE